MVTDWITYLQDADVVNSLSFVFAYPSLTSLSHINYLYKKDLPTSLSDSQRASILW